MTKKDLKYEVMRLYDLFLNKEEKRGISYGEIYYIESLKIKELRQLYNELIEEDLL